MAQQNIKSANKLLWHGAFPILFGIADDAAKSITAVKANLLISQIIDKKTNKKKKHKAKQRNAKTEAKRNRQAKEQTREEEYPSSKRLKR